MFECLILGDSIAAGIATYRPECEVVAEIGSASAAFVANYSVPQGAQRVIISLGSNDRLDPSDALAELRARIDGQVVWVMPARRHAVSRRAVAAIARANGDRLVEIPSVRADGTHPADYRALAERTRR